MADGRRIYLLAEGRLINLAAAEGHPASVMDMSFANQALSAEYVVKHHADLERKVYVVPEDIDREIARLKLATHGRRDRRLTAEQAAVPRIVGRGHLAGPRPQRGRERIVDWRRLDVIRLEDGAVVLLDQTRLPASASSAGYDDGDEIVEAIQALACAARRRSVWPRPTAPSRRPPAAGRRASSTAACDGLAAARPTAVNLAWAIDRGARRLEGAGGDELARRLARRSARIHGEEVDRCRAMGAHGAGPARRGARVLPTATPAPWRPPATARRWA